MEYSNPLNSWHMALEHQFHIIFQVVHQDNQKHGLDNIIDYLTKKLLSINEAAISAPIPLYGKPFSTVTILLVFYTDLTRASLSRGLMVLRFITSQFIPYSLSY